MSEPDVPAAADGNRNRAHPEVRFAPEQHEIDLRAVARELAAEPASRGGRRQRALYRHGRLTVALFPFEAGGGLPDHVAAGVVTINVLDGRLRVIAGAEEHDLPAGKLLVLAPGVRHDVAAPEASTMLLQVYLDDAAAAGSAAKQ
jgi:quercetin dioxygenase-like cupin family protein